MYVDSPEKPFTAVEWCAGYAGIHLGLKRAIPNLRVIAFSEIEAFACANLVAKMEAGLLEPAPVWPNLKTFPSAAFANKVDILVAGYPCQPFSTAGKRQGTEDERHLWPYIADGIRAMRPRFCFFENVEGHITLGLSTVISDLAEMGYQTTWGVFSASEVGAPHQRKRVFILAYNSSKGLQGLRERSEQEGRQEPSGHIGSCGDSWRSERSGVWPSRPGQEQYEWEPPRVVSKPNSSRLEEPTVCNTDVSMRPGRGQESRGETESVWAVEPTLGGDSDGTPNWVDYAELYESCDNRVDELRLLGNGVVLATAARAWEVLYARLMGNT